MAKTEFFFQKSHFFEKTLSHALENCQNKPFWTSRPQEAPHGKTEGTFVIRTFKNKKNGRIKIFSFGPLPPIFGAFSHIFGAIF